MNVIMKATDNINLSLLGTVLLASCLITSAGAADLTVTNTFVDGNVLSAGELNTNFDDVKTAVDDNNTKIGANTTDITSNASNITTNASDIGTNAVNIGINSSAVTDHGTRIIDLESASPAVGHIALTATLSGAVSGSLVDASSTTVTSTMFPKPSDYVTGTITLKALVSGCAGKNVRVSISRTGVNVGINGGFFVILPPSQTVFIPLGVGFPTPYYVVEVTTTATSFYELNRVSLQRSGADVLDTCTTTLKVEGFIVEYPRG